MRWTNCFRSSWSNQRKSRYLFPGFEIQLISAKYQEALVQKDGNIITAKGPAAALVFAYTLLEALGGNSEEIKESMQYRYLENDI